MFHPGAIEVTRLAHYTGHRDCVYALARFPQSPFVYSASGDGSVARWDLREPLLDGVINARVSSSVYALCPLPGTDILLIAENFSGLHAVDMKLKKESASVKFTESAIFDVQHSAAGTHIYVACGDGQLHLIESLALRRLQSIQLGKDSIRCLALDASGGLLAAGSSDGFIRVLSAQSLKVLYEFRAHDNSVFAVRFLPNGLLVSGSRDAKLKTWDPAKGFSPVQTVPAHLYAINSLAVLPASAQRQALLLSAGMDKTIKVWDADTLRLLKVIDYARHGGHTASVNRVCAIQHPDFPDTFISCSDDRTVSVWRLKEPA
ncbi:MAG: WD40 repeat domain-containing protein [Bacteroidota bacterium]